MRPCLVRLCPSLDRLRAAFAPCAALLPLSAGSAQAGPTPYHGSPAAVSATTTTRVEAEDYDLGGEGVAYHDTDNGGQTVYRGDNVGVYQDGNASGGYFVYATAGGEWDGYTLSVAQAGSYALTARISAGFAVALSQPTASVRAGGTARGVITVTPVGGFAGPVRLRVTGLLGLLGPVPAPPVIAPALSPSAVTLDDTQAEGTYTPPAPRSRNSQDQVRTPARIMPYSVL